MKPSPQRGAREENLGGAVAGLSRLVRADAVAFFVRRDGTWQLSRSEGFSEEELDALDGAGRDGASTLFATAVSRRESVLVNNAGEVSDRNEVMAKAALMLDMKTLVIVPVQIGDDIAGAAVLFFRGASALPGDYARELTPLFSSLAGAAAEMAEFRARLSRIWRDKSHVFKQLLIPSPSLEHGTLEDEARFVSALARKVLGLSAELERRQDLLDHEVQIRTKEVNREMMERLRAERELKLAQNDLEARVETRTRDLEEANKKLHLEIVEREKTEEALRQSEERYRQLVEGGKIIGWEFDITSWRFTFVSGGAEAMLGYPVAEWNQEGFWQRLLHPEDRDRVVKTLRKAVEHGGDCDIEYRVTARDGSVVWVRDINTILKDSTGAPHGIRGFLVDITARKLAEHMLLESEEKYRALINQAGDAIVLTDDEGLIVDANRKAEELFGYTRDEFRKLNYATLPAESDMERARNSFAEVLEKGYLVINDARVVDKNGAEISVDITTTKVRYAGKQLLQAVFHDMTERRLGEEKLKNAYAETEALLAAIPSIFIGVDENDIIMRWNTSAENIFRIPRSGVVKKSLWNCGVKWDWGEFYRAIESCRNEKAPYVIENMRYVVNEDFIGYLHLTVTPLLKSDGRFGGFLILGSDVTEHRLAQEKLRLSATVYENAMEGIVVTDENTVIQSVNPAFTNITGYSPEEVIGKTPKILKSGKHGPDFYRNMWDSLSRYGQWEGEIWNRRKNGDIYPEWITITAIKDEKGATVKYASVFRDITEIKIAEDELRRQREIMLQSEKLAAIGKLASGVAHELNQPLNHMAITCQYLRKMLSADGFEREKVLDEVEMIDENIHRAVEVIRSMRDFARKDANNVQPIDVRKAVDNAVKIFGSQLRSHGIDLRVRAPEQPVMAYGITNRLSQVVVNMITNARDALDNVRDNREKRLAIEIVTSGRAVQIVISDNGNGIPRDVIANIFTPFFTTKPPGVGTGLGLSISYQIIREFSGDIEVESYEGKGTTMRITLKKASEDLT